MEMSEMAKSDNTFLLEPKQKKKKSTRLFGEFYQAQRHVTTRCPKSLKNPRPKLNR